MSVIVLGDYLLGKVEILKASARSTTFDLNDSTVSTAFENFNMKSIIGTDVAGVIAYVTIADSSATEIVTLLTKESGGASGDIDQRTLRIEASRRATTQLRIGSVIILPCRGADPGTLDYAEQTGQPIASIQVVIWGRIRP